MKQSKLTDQECADYAKNVIKNNSIERVFPITHKNNHGIDLLYWLLAAQSLCLNVEIRVYMHHVADGTNGKNNFEAQELIIV